MQCPHCHKEIQSESHPCPHCGVLPFKWRERQINVSLGELSIYVNVTTSEFNWTILVLIALTLACVFFFMGREL